MSDKLSKTTALAKLIRFEIWSRARIYKSHEVYRDQRKYRTLNTAEKVVDSLIYRNDQFSAVFTTFV